MIRHQLFDLFRVVVRETQFTADSLGHPRANFDMSIEADSCARAFGWRKCRRLADVMEKHAPGQSSGAIWQKFLQHHSRVNPNVSLWMKLGRLLDALHASNVWEHDSEQTGFVEQLESPPRGAFGQQLR